MRKKVLLVSVGVLIAAGVVAGVLVATREADEQIAPVPGPAPVSKPGQPSDRPGDTPAKPVERGAPGRLEGMLTVEGDPAPDVQMLLRIASVDPGRLGKPFEDLRTAVKGGRFAFESMPSGDFTACFVPQELSVSRPVRLEIKPGQTAKMDVDLPGTCKVRLLFLRGGAPAEVKSVKASVRHVQWPETEVFPLPEVESEGSAEPGASFAIARVTPGYNAFSGLCDQAEWECAAWCASGGEKEIRIELEAKGISGTVEADDGKPIAGAAVTSKIALPGALPHYGVGFIAWSGLNGRFKFPAIAQGTKVALNAWSPGYVCEKAFETVFDPEHPPESVVLRLSRTGPASVSVRFVNQDGSPFGGRIEYMGMLADRSGQTCNLPFTAVPGSPGVFLCEGLSAGMNVVLEPVPSGDIIVAPGETSLTLEKGRNPDAEFRMLKEPEIGGRIVDQDGKPVEGCSVWLEDGKPAPWMHYIRAGYTERQAKTDQNGRFSIKGFKSGGMYLVALALTDDRVLMACAGPFKLVAGEKTDAGDAVLEEAGKWEGPCLVLFTLKNAGGQPVRNTEGFYRIAGGTTWGSGPLEYDADGRVSVRILGPGEYTVLLELPGYLPHAQEDIVYEGKRTYEFEVALRAGGASLRGRIGGVPPETAGKIVVSLARKEKGTGMSSTLKTNSGADGRFVFPSLIPDHYVLSLSETGPYMPSAVKIALAVDAVDEAENSLKSGEELSIWPVLGAAIAGKLVYSDGSPAGGHSVYALLKTGTGDPEDIGDEDWKAVYRKLRGESSADGTFRLEGIPGGEYDVVSDDEAKETVKVALGGESKMVVVKLDQEPPVEAPAAKLKTRVQVSYPDGKPAAGCRVVFMDDCCEFYYLGEAGENGQAAIEGDEIAGGVARICAVMPGYAPSEIAWIRMGSQPEAAELRLRRGAEISGRVFLPEAGISGEVAVTASFWGWSGSSEMRFQSKVGKDGEYRIADLPPGVFNVRLEFAGGGEDQIGMHCASRKYVALAEGEKKTADLDFRSFGKVTIESNLDSEPEEEGGFDEPAVNGNVFWPASWKSSVYPPECPFEESEIMWSGPEQDLQPGRYVAAKEIGFKRARLWIVNEGVQVEAGGVRKVVLDFDAGECGCVDGRIQAKQGEGFLRLYGVFLWRDGVRALIRPEPSGRVRFDKLPPGTYQARLIWGCWWEVVRDLKPVAVEKGKTADLGCMQGRD